MEFGDEPKKYSEVPIPYLRSVAYDHSLSTTDDRIYASFQTS